MPRTITTLQSLRFAFVFLVFLSHLPSGFEAGGVCGVSLFFVLSGFVLSEGYGERLCEGRFVWRKFFVRRLIRVVPLHLTGVLLFLAVYRNHLSVADWPFYVCNVLLLQSWIPLHDCYFSLNGVSWFVSSILPAYALFPVLWRAVHGFPLRRVLCAAIAVVCAYVAIVAFLPDTVTEAWLYVFPPVRLLDFTLGIVAHRVYVLLRSSGGLKCASLWEWLPVLLLATNVAVSPLLPERYFYVAQFWPTAVATILIFALADDGGGQLNRWLKTPWMVWLGGISFEFYMLHKLLMECVVYSFFRLCPAAPSWLQYVVAFLLILPLCRAVKRALAVLTKAALPAATV